LVGTLYGPLVSSIITQRWSGTVLSAIKKLFINIQNFGRR
jgi:hypothetical protein